MAVHRNKGKVCVLFPCELAALENGQAPNCEKHYHISRTEADRLTELTVNTPHRKEREAVYIGKGKRYLAFERSAFWAPRASSGFIVMQLVAGAAAL